MVHSGCIVTFVFHKNSLAFKPFFKIASCSIDRYKNNYYHSKFTSGLILFLSKSRKCSLCNDCLQAASLYLLLTSAKLITIVILKWCLTVFKLKTEHIRISVTVVKFCCIRNRLLIQPHADCKNIPIT